MDYSSVERITDYSGVDWTETTGARLYRRARNLIPGGVQLLSKRPERFLPRQWPAYFSKARGCEIWDLDGRRFRDTTIHCVGACLLGYADPDVNAAVRDAIDRGNMATLNSPAEVELAELFCELHPWADMVRYARAGGETMTVAVRIARAATGREKVAFCGYHGWSDWYLASNLGDHDALFGGPFAGEDAEEDLAVGEELNERRGRRGGPLGLAGDRDLGTGPVGLVGGRACDHRQGEHRDAGQETPGTDMGNGGRGSRACVRVVGSGRWHGVGVAFRNCGGGGPAGGESVYSAARSAGRLGRCRAGVRIGGPDGRALTFAPTFRIQPNRPSEGE